MKKLFLIFALCFFTANIASAHQPRIVQSGQDVFVKNPEISQAFYGELKGAPAYYQINSDKPFDLYVSILVPDIKDVAKNISVEVSKEGEAPFISLDGENFEWVSFYEEFAGDNYFQGPNWGPQNVEAGNYRVKISNPGNLGKYSFVVGQKEEFPPSEILNTILTLPSLKQNFFNKSPLTAYFNLIGVFLLVLLILLAAIIFALIKIFKKLRRSPNG